MPKQSDLDFANLVLSEKLATREQVEDCLELLKNLREEAGVEDSLDGILCLKGIITETQANMIWKKIASGEVDDIVEAFPQKSEAPAARPASPAQPAREPAKPEPAKQASPYPAVPGCNIVAKLEKDSTGLNYLSDTPKGRKKIVHLMYPQTAANEKLLKWLSRYGQALAKLDHPSIARFEPPKTFENRVFFTQEIPSGEQIASILEEEGAFGEEKALAVFGELAGILSYIESAGFSHGRITPQNLYLAQGEKIEIRMFTSLERELRLVSGKIDREDAIFVPPELQKPGEKAGPKSDMYSAGMILLYLAAGPDLLSAGPALAIEGLPKRIRTIASKLIDGKPDNRYSSFSELEKDLGAEPAQEEEAAKPAASPRPEGGLLRKKTDSHRAAGDGKRKLHGGRRAEERAGRKHSGRRAEVEEVVEVEPLEPEVMEEEPLPEPEPIPEPEPVVEEEEKKRPSQKRVEEAPAKKKLATRRIEAPPEAPPPEPAKPKEEPPDPRYLKKIEAADSKEAKGDYSGAMAKLGEALEFAPARAAVKRRMEALRDKAFKELSAEADGKEEAGALDEAILLFEKAREFAPDPAEVDKIVSVLKTRIEAEKKSARFRKIDEEAREKASGGDVAGAMELLRGARDLSDNPAAVDAEIESLARTAYEDRISRSRALEEKGEFDEAESMVEEAKAFAPDAETAEAVMAALQKRKADRQRRDEYSKCEAAAKKAAEEGNVESAVQWWTKAKEFSGTPVAVQAKIDNLKSDAFKKLMDRSAEEQAQGRFISAVELCEKAKQWAPEPAEVEAAIEAIKSAMEEAEKKKKFDELKTAADKHETTGDLRAALEKMYEAAEVSDSTVSARMRIDTLKKKIFDEGVLRGKELEKEGKFKQAVKTYEEISKYATNQKSVELLIATAKRESSRQKKESEFRRIEAEARARLKEGDYKGALETMETAREFSESHVTFDAKIEGLKKAAFDTLCAKAKELEASGDWSEAIAAYEKAKPFADSPADIDGIIAAIREETDRIRRKADFDRRLAEAGELAAAGRIKDSVKVLEEAKQFSPDPAAVQSRIDRLLIDSMVGKLVELAKQKEAAGDLDGALAACEKARGFKAQNPDLDAVFARISAAKAGSSTAVAGISDNTPVPDAVGSDEATSITVEAPAAQEKPKAPGGRPMADLIAALPPVEEEPRAKEGEAHEKRPSGEAVKVTCKSCKKMFLVKKEYEGKKGKCPKCKATVQIPMSGKKVVCFLCDKVLPEGRAKKRGDEYYCPECDDFIGG